MENKLLSASIDVVSVCRGDIQSNILRLSKERSVCGSQPSVLHLNYSGSIIQTETSIAVEQKYIFVNRNN